MFCVVMVCLGVCVSVGVVLFDVVYVFVVFVVVYCCVCVRLFV